MLEELKSIITVKVDYWEFFNTKRTLPFYDALNMYILAKTDGDCSKFLEQIKVYINSNPCSSISIIIVKIIQCL